MWSFNKTSDFVKCSENLSLSEQVLTAIESWAVSVGRVPTNKQKKYFCSPHNIFEIWVARVPDPDSNKGSSGGFRMIYFLNIKESSIHIDRIEKRTDIGYKGEKTKSKQKWEKYLEELKAYLLETLDKENEK